MFSDLCLVSEAKLLLEFGVSHLASQNAGGRDIQV
jgi:hypothetical protein